MKHLLLWLVVVVGLIGPADEVALGQTPEAATSSLNAAMIKLFGKHTAFTARADVRMLDGAEKESLSMIMNIASLEGKLSAEVDMAQMKSAQMSPEIAVQMKQMGMDRMISITRSDKKTRYLVYPGLKSYVDMPMPKEEVAALESEPKIEKTPEGKETIDGHPTVRSKVVLTDSDGKRQEMLVWTATDLKDFPVQMQMKENGNTMRMTYKDIRLAKPDAKQFEPPAGFAKYDNMQQLQQVMVQRMMKGPGQ